MKALLIYLQFVLFLFIKKQNCWNNKFSNREYLNSAKLNKKREHGETRLLSFPSEWNEIAIDQRKHLEAASKDWSFIERPVPFIRQTSIQALSFFPECLQIQLTEQPVSFLMNLSFRFREKILHCDLFRNLSQGPQKSFNKKTSAKPLCGFVFRKSRSEDFI